MIILRTDKPIANRDDVWCSEINIRLLTPARRDKLVSLMEVASFTLRAGTEDMLAGEIRTIDNLLKIEDGV